MSDLISRQDIKYHTQLEAMGNGQYEEVEVAYKNDIESLPSADAVKVVRCKDCKYAEPYDDSTYPIHCSYDFPMTEQGTWVKPNDFCSNGERKKP